MAHTIDTLTSDALALDSAQRASLAHALIASLDTEVDAGAEAEWLAIIERRVAEMCAGQSRGLPLDGLLQELRTRS